MAKQSFTPGGQIETLSPGELRHHLDEVVREWFQEKGRGVGPWRAYRTAAVGGGNLTLPGNESAKEPFGPSRGFAVGVREIRVAGLATGDTVSLWRNSATNPGNFLRTITAATPFTTFSKGACTLRNGDSLVITGTGLTATGDITANGEGVELPDIDAYKLL